MATKQRIKENGGLVIYRQKIIPAVNIGGILLSIATAGLYYRFLAFSSMYFGNVEVSAPK